MRSVPRAKISIKVSKRHSQRLVVVQAFRQALYQLCGGLNRIRDTLTANWVDHRRRITDQRSTRVSENGHAGNVRQVMRALIT
jgi:hypothetical protein